MLGLRARQILALVLVMAAIAMVSMLLEITGVTRAAVDDARRESHYAARTLTVQISQVVASNPGVEPLDAIREDPVLQVSLGAMTQYASTVLYAAFTDSTGRAILHTDPARVGARASEHPPLPELGGPVETWRFLAALYRGGQIHEEQTPLRIGHRRFGVVRVAMSPTFLRHEVNRVFHRGLYLAVFYILVATVAAFFLTRIVLGPLGEVRRGIEALHAGDFSYRIPQQNIQEFGLMAQALNELGAQIHAREASRGDHESLRRAVELLGDGLLMVSPDRRVTLVNGLAAGFLGVEAPSALGRPLSETLPPDHPLAVFVEELITGPNDHLSRRADLPGAESRGVMVMGSRIRGKRGVAGVLIEIKDLAVLRDLQAVMDHSTVLSRLGEMAAGVAHEIRNPLNAITLHLEPLRRAETLDPESLRQSVETVRAEITRLDRVVSGFLKVARLRKLSVTPMDPGPMITEVAELVAPEATMAGLELVRDYPASLPAISGDPEVVRQALLNVVKNAIQALPSGDGRIRIAAREEEDRVLFEVSDTGPGMTPEVRRQAFDLYMTTKESGTGVGLAFVRQAVEMHGGKVELASEPGRGTRVTLEFRVSRERGGARGDVAVGAAARGAAS